MDLKRNVFLFVLFIILANCMCLQVFAVDADVGVDDYSVIQSDNAAYEVYLYDDDGELIPIVLDQRVVEPGDGSNEFVGLTIHSSMFSFMDASVPFDIVYNVRAELDGWTVYSNVLDCEVSDANGGDIVLLDKIPVGASVSVECVYPGPCYSLYSGYDPVVVFDDTMDLSSITANFGFVYDFDNVVGCGIVNNFQLGALAGGELVDETVRMPETGGHGIVGHIVLGCVLIVCGMFVARKKGVGA